MNNDGKPWPGLAIQRRSFIKLFAAAGFATALDPVNALNSDGINDGGSLSVSAAYHADRIPNEYSLFLPGEREALQAPPAVSKLAGGHWLARAGSTSKTLQAGEQINGWRLLEIAPIDGVETCVFEKHATHRGAIGFVTQQSGLIALVPKQIGKLSSIRPRPIHSPEHVQLRRNYRYTHGPDVAGEYILNSADDPSYENVGALGAEYIGYTLVANEEAGPLKSLFLDASGKSRQLNPELGVAATWIPDANGALFDPLSLAPGENPQIFQYEHGCSKRTMLGGYLPAADIGVWNEHYKAGYEAIVLLPAGTDAKPIARIRFQVPPDYLPADHPVTRDENGHLYVDRYWNTSAENFYATLANVWKRWHTLYEDKMPVEIPDDWLLDAARAGITLSRCSYRGLHPTYEIGEGAYTKIPERSHALFPVAQYEFIWGQQLWNLTEESDPYFRFYLDHYILSDGNFLYNTQDQVEAPLNTGIFLANSARSYFYTRDFSALEQRLPALRKMLNYVLARYEYSKRHFAPDDRHYGLIWGSPEADLGDPVHDAPDSHPYYYQNATWTWRGIAEHCKCLRAAAQDSKREDLHFEAAGLEQIATEMRTNIQKSLDATLRQCDPAMRAAGITPITPDDISRQPTQLSNYENHRFMEDWFTADWGVPALDVGHLTHRRIAGEQILGLGTDGHVDRISNFMAHGTLAVGIRQQDYRPFLLALYGLACFAADSGNRCSPEDAYIPAGASGEGNPFSWSPVVNSVLQPTLALRWMLCYEENDANLCHLQKATPKHWFRQEQLISVRHCPTRFGSISWSTRAISDRQWKIVLDTSPKFSADVAVHIHPSDGRNLRQASLGTVQQQFLQLPRATFEKSTHFEIIVSS